METEEGAVVTVPKKKSPKPEESKSKKEHVNVVFIGHVGKCRALQYLFEKLSSSKILKNNKD